VAAGRPRRKVTLSLQKNVGVFFGTSAVMPGAKILVCERNGHWAVALRRALRRTRQRVHETRSFAECRQELARSEASFVAWELVPGSDELMLRRLLELRRDFPRACVAVLARRGLESFQWVLRAAGACHVVFSPRDAASVARLVERHVAETAEEDLTFREAVWRRLPWKSPLPTSREPETSSPRPEDRLRSSPSPDLTKGESDGPKPR
jgi:hypothetical protein